MIGGLTENLETAEKHLDKTVRFMLIVGIVYDSPSDQGHWFLELVLRDVPTTILDPHGL
jgi:hypothetical protein